MNTGYHTPILCKECINGLNINPEGVYIDATFGGGGHSKAILSKLRKKGKLFAFDQDKDAYKNALTSENFVFVHSNFLFIEQFMKYFGIEKVDGILADLGVSSHQINEKERGFTFMKDCALDMRMNTGQKKSAKTILNTFSEKELADIFWKYGELRHSRAFAKRIVETRNETALETSEQFIECLFPEKKYRNYKTLAKIFQAIRIEVNNEIEVLKTFLSSTERLLKKEGRLCVLSFHSLEDRLVKQYVRYGNFENTPLKDTYGKDIKPFQTITKKPLQASEDEIGLNSRARSAKLRIAEKL